MAAKVQGALRVVIDSSKKMARRPPRAPTQSEPRSYRPTKGRKNNDLLNRKPSAGSRARTYNRGSGSSGSLADSLNHSLIYGIRACEAAAHIRPQALNRVFLQRNLLSRFKSTSEYCRLHNIPFKVVDSEELERLTKSYHHEGVCFFTSAPKVWSFDEWIKLRIIRDRILVLFLVGVDNPHNIGAVIRAAAHFGVQAVCLTHSSHAVAPSALRVAEGGAEYVELVYVPDPISAISAFQKCGFALVATVPDAELDLFTVSFSARTVLAIGSEADGLPPQILERLETRVRIPGSGKIESLNVATATAICAAEWFREFGVV